MVEMTMNDDAGHKYLSLLYANGFCSLDDMIDQGWHVTDPSVTAQYVMYLHRQASGVWAYHGVKTHEQAMGLLPRLKIVGSEFLGCGPQYAALSFATGIVVLDHARKTRDLEVGHDVFTASRHNANAVLDYFGITSFEEAIAVLTRHQSEIAGFLEEFNAGLSSDREPKNHTKETMKQIDWTKPLGKQERANGTSEAGGTLDNNADEGRVAPEDQKAVDDSEAKCVRENPPPSNRVGENHDDGPCVCCGSTNVDPYVLEGFAHPICDACVEVEEGTPELQLRGCVYFCSRRQGKWFLECCVRSTGRDCVVAELARAPRDLSKPPESIQDENGEWIWDLEFKSGEKLPACDAWGRTYVGPARGDDASEKGNNNQET
jgi:hypothetical protein